MTTAKTILEDFVSRYDLGCKEDIPKNITSNLFEDMRISDEQVRKLLSKYIEYREESKSYYAQCLWAELGEGFKKRPLMTIFRVHSLYRDWKRRYDKRQEELKIWYLDELQYVIEPETWTEKEKLRKIGLSEDMLDDIAARTVHNHPLYDAPPISEVFCKKNNEKN